jgi:hypothetical protein
MCRRYCLEQTSLEPAMKVMKVWYCQRLDLIHVTKEYGDNGPIYEMVSVLRDDAFMKMKWPPWQHGWLYIGKY